ncbi:MAG: hypothetical protein WC501_02755 [Candidatus Micrarchaeia archaeon]
MSNLEGYLNNVDGVTKQAIQKKVLTRMDLKGENRFYNSIEAKTKIRLFDTLVYLLHYYSGSDEETVKQNTLQKLIEFCVNHGAFFNLLELSDDKELPPIVREAFKNNMANAILHFIKNHHFSLYEIVYISKSENFHPLIRQVAMDNLNDSALYHIENGASVIDLISIANDTKMFSPSVRNIASDDIKIRTKYYIEHTVKEKNWPGADSFIKSFNTLSKNQISLSVLQDDQYHKLIEELICGVFSIEYNEYRKDSSNGNFAIIFVNIVILLFQAIPENFYESVSQKFFEVMKRNPTIVYMLTNDEALPLSLREFFGSKYLDLIENNSHDKIKFCNKMVKICNSENSPSSMRIYAGKQYVCALLDTYMHPEDLLLKLIKNEKTLGEVRVFAQIKLNQIFKKVIDELKLNERNPLERDGIISKPKFRFIKKLVKPFRRLVKT